MSIKKYEVLLRVVELGSLTKAAEASGCSQSAVSHILNDLEEEFGFTILKRSRGGVQLTENGAKILPSIRGILNYNEQLSQTVAELQNEVRQLKNSGKRKAQQEVATDEL